MVKRKENILWRIRPPQANVFVVVGGMFDVVNRQLPMEVERCQEAMHKQRDTNEDTRDHTQPKDHSPVPLLTEEAKNPAGQGERLQS